MPGPGIKLLLPRALSHCPGHICLRILKKNHCPSYCLSWEAVALASICLVFLEVGLGENCDLSTVQMTFTTAVEFYRCFFFFENVVQVLEGLLLIVYCLYLKYRYMSLLKACPLKKIWEISECIRLKKVTSNSPCLFRKCNSL